MFEKLHDFFMNPSQTIKEERMYRAAVQDMERRIAEHEKEDLEKAAAENQSVSIKGKEES